jgi:hypothetical protein
MLSTVGTYTQFIVLGAFAVLFLVAAIVVRRRWDSPPSRLRQLLARPPAHHSADQLDSLAGLLIFEDTHRAFVDLLGLVLAKFSLGYFEDEESFAQALDFLNRAALEPVNPVAVQSAMCHMVQCLVENPDVEYACRPEFDELLSSFLLQAESSSAA